MFDLEHFAFTLPQTLAGRFIITGKTLGSKVVEDVNRKLDRIADHNTWIFVFTDAQSDPIVTDCLYGSFSVSRSAEGIRFRTSAAIPTEKYEATGAREFIEHIHRERQLVATFYPFAPFVEDISRQTLCATAYLPYSRTTDLVRYAQEFLERFLDEVLLGIALFVSMSEDATRE